MRVNGIWEGLYNGADDAAHCITRQMWKRWRRAILDVDLLYSDSRDFQLSQNVETFIMDVAKECGYVACDLLSDFEWRMATSGFLAAMRRPTLRSTRTVAIRRFRSFLLHRVVATGFIPSGLVVRPG